MPSLRPCARPPSRYATPSATYFTLKTVRRLGSSERAINAVSALTGLSGAPAGEGAAGASEIAETSAVEDGFAGWVSAGELGAADTEVFRVTAAELTTIWR